MVLELLVDDHDKREEEEDEDDYVAPVVFGFRECELLLDDDVNHEVGCEGEGDVEEYEERLGVGCGFAVVRLHDARRKGRRPPGAK